jgi:hypothetical protein
MDQAVGTTALDSYMGQRGQLAAEVVEDDEVAQALLRLMFDEELWSGSATDLFGAITPPTPSKTWPRNPRGLSGRLRRLAPAFHQATALRLDFSQKRRIEIKKEADCPPFAPFAPSRVAPAGAKDSPAGASDSPAGANSGPAERHVLSSDWPSADGKDAKDGKSPSFLILDDQDGYEEEAVDALVAADEAPPEDEEAL